MITNTTLPQDCQKPMDPDLVAFIQAWRTLPKWHRKLWVIRIVVAAIPGRVRRWFAQFKIA